MSETEECSILELIWELTQRAIDFPHNMYMTRIQLQELINGV